MPLDVYLLPALTSAEELAGRTVVVIDVLRATTTITQALSAGAREVIPCLEVEEAHKIAASLSGGVVMGGERGGRRIEGFDLGNSPAEYTAESVGGKTVVFTTTNGTRAMQQCCGARRVLLGAFSSLSALVTELRKEDDFALLCAGTDGHVTREDVLFAGAVIRELVAIKQAPMPPWNDEALLAVSAWQRLPRWSEKDKAAIPCDDLPIPTPRRPWKAIVQELLRSNLGQEIEFLVNALHESRGGRNLSDLGMNDDIIFAAQTDTTRVVAELHVSECRIRPLMTSGLC